MAAPIPLLSWCCKVSANTTSSPLSSVREFGPIGAQGSEGSAEPGNRRMLRTILASVRAMRAPDARFGTRLQAYAERRESRRLFSVHLKMSRWKAAAIHLVLSAAIASGVLLFMLTVWYPWPFFEAAGGNQLI